VRLETINSIAQIVAAIGVIASLFYLAVQIRQNTFKLFENAWFQKRQGTLDAQQWEGWPAYARVYFHLPGVKTWWELRRAAFAHRFRNYIETSRPIAEMTSLSEIIRGKP
jgi:hypothetical protein